MTGDLFARDAGALRKPLSCELRLGTWERVLHDVGDVDTLITDAPYSERCQSGHNRGSVPTGRAGLGFTAWTERHVADFVTAWAPRTRGWFVTITDHVLAVAWERELKRAGRLVFAPLPFVATGSRVRLQGDGPTLWACWIVVARPRREPWSKWGALPGAYVLPQGESRKSAMTGGKPLWLMRELVKDYSREGDLVCDPCAGAGTTLLAARLEGRCAVGAEAIDEHYQVAQARLREAA